MWTTKWAKLMFCFAVMIVLVIAPGGCDYLESLFETEPLEEEQEPEEVPLGPCEIPGYPEVPDNFADHGLSWCPASVDIQVRAHALAAAVSWCAINRRIATTESQVSAQKAAIRDNCDILDNWETRRPAGVPQCVCTQNYRNNGPS